MCYLVALNLPSGVSVVRKTEGGRADHVRDSIPYLHAANAMSLVMKAGLAARRQATVTVFFSGQSALDVIFWMFSSSRCSLEFLGSSEGDIIRN